MESITSTSTNVSISNVQVFYSDLRWIKIMLYNCVRIPLSGLVLEHTNMDSDLALPFHSGFPCYFYYHYFFNDPIAGFSGLLLLAFICKIAREIIQTYPQEKITLYSRYNDIYINSQKNMFCFTHWQNLLVLLHLMLDFFVRVIEMILQQVSVVHLPILPNTDGLFHLFKNIMSINSMWNQGLNT